MFGFGNLICFSLLLPFGSALSSLHGMDAGRAVHLPIYRKDLSKLDKRDGEIAAIGLGDVLDITYNVIIQVGSTQTTLVLDTGSSDLWLVSDACTGDCPVSGMSLYSQNSLHSAGPDVYLLYGDSRTGTHASGPIGIDTVGIAGLSISNQSFAAISDTNTTVLNTGSAGILGLGFPPISVIWRQLLEAELNQSNSTAKRSSILVTDESQDGSTLPLNTSIGRPPFPSFDFLWPKKPSHKRQFGSTPLPSSTTAVASFAAFGPLFTRLITQQMLSAPLIATTLQRDTLEVGGNAGLLSIGGLPGGVQDDHLTWVPVRGYGVADGGLPPSPDAPNEVYPLVWEIPVDDVYFDGQKLPRSTVSSPSISLSALLDTGNSLIRGPQDVIANILARLGGHTTVFDCSIAHNLSFQIGGVLFPVDPRDFAQPSPAGSSDQMSCTPALAATDPPGNGGFLYSWSLGDPFLKSVLVAFYYGNLTHPSQNPPRVGLLSTVPADSGDALREAVQMAAAAGGFFPATSDPAPAGTYVATSTGIGGVPQATHLPTIQKTSSALTAFPGTFVDGWSSPLLIGLTIVVGLLEILYI